jgi:predicted metal-dependent hydrolase
MKLKIRYAGEDIEVQVLFSKRKTMGISIEPTGDIKVRSPIGIPEDVIIEMVKGKAAWISKKLYYFKHRPYQSASREFVTGELFMYLGRECPIEMNLDVNIERPNVTILNDKIIVTTKNNDKEYIRKALELWYREMAKEEINKRVSFYQKYFNMKPSEIKVKEQKRRWGSCTYKDSLLFNWRCVMAKESVLDYIVVHEMCHMVHKNHSKEYWKAVASILPDYKQREQWLKYNGAKMDL